MEACEFPADPIIVRCTSVDHLTSELRSRRAPVIKPLDDPRRLWIGFYVPKTNEWFVLRLATIERDGNEIKKFNDITDRIRFALGLELKDSWQHESI